MIFKIGSGYSGEEDCYVNFDRANKKITLYTGGSTVYFDGHS